MTRSIHGDDGSRRRAASRLGAHAGSYPRRRRLGREEELVLVRRAAAGDREALSGLFEAHFPLAVRTAMAQEGRGLPLEDLIGEACVGLVEAVSRFDTRRGTRFMTYAIWWIRRRVVQAIAHQARNVRIPRHEWTAAARSPEGAAALHPRELSLSEASTGAGERPLAELLPASTEPLEESIERDDQARVLRRALDALTPRQRWILERRFGLDRPEESTLQALADELGLSKERVRQVEAQALARLRGSLAPGEVSGGGAAVAAVG